MRYNQLGRTGLYVSELCLGTMTFGGDQAASGARSARSSRMRSTPSSAARSPPASTSSTPRTSIPSGASEKLLGQALKNLGVRAQRRGDRHQGLRRDGRRAERPRRLARPHHGLGRAQPRAAADRPHRPLPDPRQRYRRRRSRRRCARSTTSCAAGWSATSAAPTGRPGRSPRRWASPSGAARRASRRCRPTTRSPAATSSASSCRCSSRSSVGLMVWSPLAGGLLSGKFGPGAPGSRRTRAARASTSRRSTRTAPGPASRRCARSPTRHGVSVARVALAWLLAKPFVTSVIIGAKESTSSTTTLPRPRFRLTAEELARLDAVSALPSEYPGWMLERQNAGRRPKAVGPDRD